MECLRLPDNVNNDDDDDDDDDDDLDKRICLCLFHVPF